MRALTAPNDNSAKYETLQKAIFCYLNSPNTFEKVATKYDIPITLLKRCYYRWLTTNSVRQPEVFSDVQFTLKTAGRPPILFPDEEELIKDALEYYIENNTPLTIEGFRDLAQHAIRLFPPERQTQIQFNDMRPSKNWVKGFLKRHPNLRITTMRAIEDRRIAAVTRENIAEHIARLQAAMQRYYIKDVNRVFNVDESGVSFRKMCGKSLRKGIGYRNKELICTVVKTRGNLDRVTVMPVVSASGAAYRPIVVFPGRQPHFRKVRGTIQTVPDFLPRDSYFYQRDIPGVDSSIFMNWATNFVKETAALREGGQKLLLLLDGYSCHIQFEHLTLFKENNIVVIGMPAHTSHVLQPLDGSVFGPYKSKLQREVHARAREKKILDAFDVADIITIAYTEALTASNICSGFRKRGTWDPLALSASITPLKNLPFADVTNTISVERRLMPTLKEVVSSFSKRSRSLLFDADVQEEGTIKINTASGANLTSDKVINALEQRRLKRNKEKEIVIVTETKRPKRY